MGWCHQFSKKRDVRQKGLASGAKRRSGTEKRAVLKTWEPFKTPDQTREKRAVKPPQRKRRNDNVNQMEARLWETDPELMAQNWFCRLWKREETGQAKGLKEEVSDG